MSASTPSSLPAAEYHYSRTLIDNLLRDNKAFHSEIGDYKQVLSAVVKKCRQAQKELDIERVKSQHLQLLEAQLDSERRKTRLAQEETAKIRERYLEMLEVTRQSVFELSEQEKEEQVMAEFLSRENQHLREMLGIARLSKEKEGEVDAALKVEEGVLSEGEAEHVALKVYRQTRVHRKQHSMGKPQKSSFLIAPERPAAEAPWDAFLKAKEESSVLGSPSSLDQLEEPK